MHEENKFALKDRVTVISASNAWERQHLGLSGVVIAISDIGIHSLRMDNGTYHFVWDWEIKYAEG